MQTKPLYSSALRMWALMLFFALPAFALAQTKVSGTITDKESKEPLIGASIQVKGKVTDVS